MPDRTSIAVRGRYVYRAGPDGAEWQADNGGAVPGAWTRVTEPLPVATVTTTPGAYPGPAPAPCDACDEETSGTPNVVTLAFTGTDATVRFHAACYAELRRQLGATAPGAAGAVG